MISVGVTFASHTFVVLDLIQNLQKNVLGTAFPGRPLRRSLKRSWNGITSQRSHPSLRLGTFLTASGEVGQFVGLCGVSR